jgi:hypothetical protein
MGAYNCNVEGNIKVVSQIYNIFIFGSSLFCNISSTFLNLTCTKQKWFLGGVAEKVFSSRPLSNHQNHIRLLLQIHFYNGSLTKSG